MAGGNLIDRNLTDRAQSISASSTAPRGVDSSPLPKDVGALKDQVDYLYRQKKECAHALNQVASEQRDTVAKAGTLETSLYQTITAIKEPHA